MLDERCTKMGRRALLGSLLALGAVMVVSAARADSVSGPSRTTLMQTAWGFRLLCAAQVLEFLGGEHRSGDGPEDPRSAPCWCS